MSTPERPLAPRCESFWEAACEALTISSEPMPSDRRGVAEQRGEQTLRRSTLYDRPTTEAAFARDTASALMRPSPSIFFLHK
jgi:hypothetical protein